MAIPFTIDLTSKAQAEAKGEEGVRSPFQEPSPELPEATIDSLPSFLQTGIEGLGWPSLMPVQAKTIPYILEGYDLVVQSRTGSGKTGAFLLPLLDLMMPEEKHTQALVLCPTRELARQIFDEFRKMNDAQPEDERFRAVAVYGGTKYGPQIEAFKAGAHLVIGTPGRILDHLDKGTLRLDNLRVLILDEADEMLSMGFYPAMKQLKRFLPDDRMGHMFSATMPHSVQRVAREFLREPSFIGIAGGTVHVDAMTHRYVQVTPMEKDRVLARLIELENPESAIIFANTRRDVDYLAQFLANFGYDAAPISSDFSQKQREQTMQRLRDGELRFLIATDVAARGIDISDLSHVFQYDVPQDREYYIHRSGRTARAGRSGVAVTLTTKEDINQFRIIERKYELDMEEIAIPTDEDVAAKVAERTLVQLEDAYREKSRLEQERIGRFVPLVETLVKEGEPEVLALLLDEFYRASLHGKPATLLASDEEADAYEPEVADDLTDDDPKEKRKARKENSRGRGRRHG
ncbi:MAG: DEAD/DEAH box helicase [Bacteroidota bacterium]